MKNHGNIWKYNEAQKLQYNDRPFDISDFDSITPYKIIKKQLSLNTITWILITATLLLAVFAALVAEGIIQIGVGGITLI